jgi:hypothetical protein
MKLVGLLLFATLSIASGTTSKVSSARLDHQGIPEISVEHGGYMNPTSCGGNPGNLTTLAAAECRKWGKMNAKVKDVTYTTNRFCKGDITRATFFCE